MFIKKLSRNDRDWARLPNKHQNGFYVPKELRDSGFFPRMEQKEREAGADEIREVYFPTDWPQYEIEGQRSRLVNYRSKGEETHLTRVPKEAFSELAPASYVIVAAIPGSDAFRCLTVDAGSDEAFYIEQAFSLDAEFEAAIFDASAVRGTQEDQAAVFLEDLTRAIQAGTLTQFLSDPVAMPSTAELALEARIQYLAELDLPCLNPFEIAAPGDAIRHLSRTVEWELFKAYQKRAVSYAAIKILFEGSDGKSVGSVLSCVLQRFGDLDALFLSASQQRKSRAGYSFEHHIEHLLDAGDVPYDRQVVLAGKRRPDFVLPSKAYFKAQTGREGGSMVLSAKTTLKERWKQVALEVSQQDLFLATVDENIASNAIEDMASVGISLVVPEGLLKSDVTEYGGHANVISFKEFFETEIGEKRRPLWAAG